MTDHHNKLRRFLAWLFPAGCICLLLIVSFNLSAPNERARAAVESILLADSPTKNKLEELSPFVAVDDHIFVVHKRIAPEPREQFSVDRPTEHAYGLGNSNLILAIRANGTVWFASPQW